LKILFVFATAAEADIFSDNSSLVRGESLFRYNETEISVLITGVGGISTAWSMQKWLCNNQRPDLVINAGIAGSYRTEIGPGTVVMPVTDCFADLGIEKNDSYYTLAEAGFMKPDDPPFKNGLISCDNEYLKSVASFVPTVNAVTVNTTSGSEKAIERIRKKFNPDIETMEGATFFYICARENMPFLALRAISNMVEPERRTEWEIPLALRNLKGKTFEILNILV
jgi:futalosine hydrolase